MKRSLNGINLCINWAIKINTEIGHFLSFEQEIITEFLNALLVLCQSQISLVYSL